MGGAHGGHQGHQCLPQAVPGKYKKIEMTGSAGIIRDPGLKPLLPEGGHFRETYRSGLFLPSGKRGKKNLSTAIYFLLKRGEVSKLHRLPFDEMFHFYTGSPVCLVIFAPGRPKPDTVVLGSDTASGQRPQHVVPSGCWQGCYLKGRGGFALMGTTMSPGFDFSDFEAAEPRKLACLYPRHRRLIEKLT